MTFEWPSWVDPLPFPFPELHKRNKKAHKGRHYSILLYLSESEWPWRLHIHLFISDDFYVIVTVINNCETDHLNLYISEGEWTSSQAAAEACRMSHVCGGGEYILSLVMFIFPPAFSLLVCNLGAVHQFHWNNTDCCKKVVNLLLLPVLNILILWRFQPVTKNSK